ncbi:hypothetical protein HPP92_027554, partial [Vanilla planifolia]
MLARNRAERGGEKPRGAELGSRIEGRVATGRVDGKARRGETGAEGGAVELWLDLTPHG